jgi:hypothetical protein
MKPLVSRFLCALALALPLVTVLLLPCQQYQDRHTLPSNTANSSFPSNSTASTPSPLLACDLYPHRIWSALESLFVPGTFSRAFIFPRFYIMRHLPRPSHPQAAVCLPSQSSHLNIQASTFALNPRLISSSSLYSCRPAAPPPRHSSLSRPATRSKLCAPR